MRSGLVAMGFVWAVACGESSRTDDAPEDPTGGRPGRNPISGGNPGAPSGGAATDAGASGVAGESSSPNAPPGDLAFADEQVLEVRLTLSAADWMELEEHGNLEEYVPAAVSLTGAGFDDVVLDSVGLRHKGNWTLHHCWDENGGVRDHADECQKLSYKIKFDEYAPDARFDGLKRINLHAASGDATRLHEYLGYATFRDFGIDAPRTVPARVFINGELQGVFIAVEEIDGRYTRAHYPDGPNGNLYKEIWPSTATADQDFLDALETNEDAGDVSDIKDFAAAIAGSGTANFVERMEPWVDLEQVLRYMAVDRAIKNWDGITAFYLPNSPHNFFWYHDDGDAGRFHLIPWDLDNVFWEFDPYMHPEQWVTADPVPDWNMQPRDCNPRGVWDQTADTRITPPRCDPFLDLLAETSWQRFVEIGNQLLAGPLALNELNRKLTARRAQIAPLVEEDPTIDLAAWNAAADMLPAMFERARRDFQALLASGLVDEAAPAEPPPTEPPPDDVDAPTEDLGLHVDGVTNFEFATPPLAEPANVFSFGDSLAVFAPSWNTSSPISGNADLRFDFTFNEQPGQYDEYVGLGVLASQPEADVTGYSSVVFTLHSSAARVVRIRLESPAYTDAWGGIWSEFGVDVPVTAGTQTLTLSLGSFAYPTWAKDAWTAGQGFTVADAEALRTVLLRFGGLVFSPAATTDSAGDLVAVSESAFIQIDNIYFR
jgi:spore coat protein H